MFFFLFHCKGYAQNSIIDWEKSYGGSETEELYQIITTSDGGYLMAGTTNSKDGQVTGFHTDGSSGTYYPTDAWVVKADNVGNIKWQKALGGSSHESARGAIEAADGSFIIAGIARSDDGDVTNHQRNDDYWIIKLDTNGSIIWDKIFNQDEWDKLYSITATNDSGFIVTGTSGGATYQTWSIKFDKNGNKEWDKNFANIAQANMVKQTADSGYIFACNTYVNGKTDVVLVKTDTACNIEWQETFGGSDFDDANDVLQTSDGGYIIVGYTESSDGDVTTNKGEADYWVIKTDDKGILQWQKTYGGAFADIAMSVLIDIDGGYIIGGSTNSNNGDISSKHNGIDAWLIKLDNAGTLVWEHVYGGSSWDAFNDVIFNSGGDLVLSGVSSSDDGDVSHNHTSGVLKKKDFWVAKLNPNTTKINSVSNGQDLFDIYPNPANDFLQISIEKTYSINRIKIISVDGKIVQEAKTSGYSTNLHVGTLPKGLYLIQVETIENKIMTKRFLKL